ncbi:MAG: Formate dehydrogenase-O, major subunit protein [Myxococcales bacterium]|nr:Formate dehydrogenase-O, major subunit protein [Myxococcales bacterium]
MLASGPVERIRTYCRICEAACGLVAEVQGGQVHRLLPDTEHPVSRGFVCTKGPAMLDVHRDPARLDHPEYRTGDTWKRASWADATGAIGARLAAIRARHGADAIAVYIGNPTAFNVGLSIYAAGFLAALGTRNFFNAASLDCQNKFAVAEHMFGHYVVQPIPDLDRTDFFLCLGSNPSVSQMSFVAMPRALERLKAIEERGGRCVFVNPRRTETAQVVGEQLFIRPDSDAFLLMAMLRVIFDEALESAIACRTLAHVDELRAAARRFVLSDVAAATGVPIEQIVDLARSFARAPSATAYCSTGVNMGSFGSLAFLGVQALNAVTGNLDRAGGALVPSRTLRFVTLARLLGRLRPPRPSRIGNFAPVAESLPTGILADEILTPGEGQIRALLCIAGNPLLSAPGGDRLAGALRSLELLVSVDLFRNETGALAHWSLPATDWIEREDFPLVQTGMQPEPYAQLSPAVVAPTHERRAEADILVDLARVAGLRMFRAPGLTRLLSRLPPAKIYPWVSRLLSLPTSRDPVKLPRDEPGVFLDAVPTRDGRVDVGPAAVLADVARAADRCTRDAASPAALRLIGRRQRRTHNSWMHNVPKERPGHAECRLAIHPDDAARLGVADGTRVRVQSAVGRVEVSAQLDTELMPGTVSLPHGWAQSNVNLLAGDGPAALEPLSGMARFNGIEVDVQRLGH